MNKSAKVIIVFSPPFLLDEESLKDMLKDQPNLVFHFDFMTDSVPVHKMSAASTLIMVTSRFQDPPASIPVIAY